MKNYPKSAKIAHKRDRKIYKEVKALLDTENKYLKRRIKYLEKIILKFKGLSQHYLQ